MIRQNILVLLVLSFSILFHASMEVLATEIAGTPLNRTKFLSLDDDLGFGKKYRLSMARKFQDWGAMKVSDSDGFPVRLGKHSIRFETREGFCGSDEGWSDCKNGRSRHELSTAVNGHDPWNKDRWYALSLFIPKGFSAPLKVKTSIFQFWAGGKDSWMFKFEAFRGFFVQRKLDHAEQVLVAPQLAVDRWMDFIIRVRHSRKSDGIMSVWVDGKNRYGYEGRTAVGDDRKRRPYFKFGIYNTAMGPDGAPIDGGGYLNGDGLPNLVVYFDEVRHGKNCGALKLADLGYDCALLTQ